MWRRYNILKLLFLGGIISFLSYIFVFGSYGYLVRRKFYKQILKLKGETEKNKQENKVLQEEIKLLEKSPSFAVEKIAREKLGLVKKGEIKYRFGP